MPFFPPSNPPISHPLSSSTSTHGTHGEFSSRPNTPSTAAAVGVADGQDVLFPTSGSGAALSSGVPQPPVTPQLYNEPDQGLMALELEDGTVCQGYSYGAQRSVAGELVFQTGMVGYPESITDPSYRGQILVMTFPLVGNYGVPSRETRDSVLGDLPAYFEAAEIHIAGLVTASYSGEDFSHYLAASSLGTWLKEQGIPAIHGVDTRALTKRIREKGSMLGRLLMQKPASNGAITNGVVKLNGVTNGTIPEDWRYDFEHIPWSNPNEKNLVAGVSTSYPRLYSPGPASALHHPSGRPARVLCLDVGLKYSQLRCLISRGVEVEVIPWNYDFPQLAGQIYDGLFISNGPGDPALMSDTVKHISTAMTQGRTPIFGICLGHQLLARAAGADTVKMKFGNRGHNIPCTNLLSGRCYITSQNHGYAVDATTLPEGWEELFVNANDGSNEGIRHVSRPYFSVQFHPESAPGPRDTEFLFDVFIDTIKRTMNSKDALLQPVRLPGGDAKKNEALHPRVEVKKVLVLGSGGLSIGQAGEFDYSGSQAIKALKEEGIYTILINPNIATIQTSKGLADKVYFLPVTAEFVRKVIKHERPDAIYVTFGGQTALQVGIQLKDEFEELGVRVLGTPIDTIITTEDRELFARSMESIGEKCAKSASASSVEEAMHVVNSIGFPVIVRAAYALGGLGSGFADDETQLLELCNKAFAASPQVLIERSMKGWKEIEYEVVRDARDNCITVCNMENFDPLGIHTGDSIVVAPSQTLSDEDYNMLRTTAVNVIRHLGVVGECNIQYALNPFSREYCIIEVNARLSRSSALASKATGFPLAFVAAKLGLGFALNELKNSVTKLTSACFEPSLDYVVVKIPRWDLKKFTRVSTLLSSSMKSVGEVMSIGRTFEEAIQKAIRSVDYNNLGFNETNALMSIDAELQTPSDQRLFAIANAMHAGYTVDKIWEMTRIDKWFLRKLKHLSDFGKLMTTYNAATIPNALIREAKQLGFSDMQLAKFWNSNDLAVRRRRVDAGITPVVRQIDTVAAEFPAFTNYLYLTYCGSEHDVDFTDRGIMVLGSGVYRIGSSVEFDWCSVRAIRTLREQGFKTVMVNYNPETVSTDYDEADRLYFENINLETVLDIYQLESSSGVIISMGGQTPNNIALPLQRLNVKVLGTSPEMIDMAENRYKFSRMLDGIFVDQPAWKELSSLEEAADFCDKVSYPVLVRPSYVLSGAAMNTVYSKDDLANYLQQAADVSRDHPVVITKYIENAKEIEMDAVAKDGIMIGHFISEHVENAGVHSGDATLILPAQDLEPETVRRIEDATRKIGNALNVTGPFNIQFIAKDNDIKVIECNVRASRSFPFVSKTMGVDLIEMATKAMLGLPVTEYPPVNIPADYVGVKVPQFSFSRLSGADPVLGVEMASTGEVACFGRTKYEAYLKALISTGFRLPKRNILLSIGSFKDKLELLPSVQRLHKLGYNLFATAGTADFLQEHGVPVKYLEVLGGQEADQKSEYSLTQHLSQNLIDLYINLPSSNRFRRPANYMSKGYRTRRMAVDYQTPLVTNVKNAKILIEAIARHYDLEISRLDYQTSHRTAELPGLVNVAAFVPGIATPGSHDFEAVTRASVAAGFSMIRIMPVGLKGSITDARTLKTAQQNTRRGASCDYNFSVAATASNADQVSQVIEEVGSLFIPFNNLSENISKVAAVTAHFSAWPSYKPIVTDAKTTDLASILLLASLHSRKVHVTNVTTKEDISVIALSKDKGLSVTCDVSVYALFISREEFPQCASLPSREDQEALWIHMPVIDVFSIGALPYQVAHESKADTSPVVGIADAIPLLFTAVADGRLSVDDIIARLHSNPIDIFDLHEQAGATVEVEYGRPYALQSSSVWSPLVGRAMKGAVQRVTFKDQTACLDGDLLPNTPQGRDMSSHLPPHIHALKSPTARAVQSPVMLPRAESGVGRRLSILETRPFSMRRQSILDGAPSSRPLTRSKLAESPFAPPPQPVYEELGPPLVPQTPVIASPLAELLSRSPFKQKHVLSVNQFSRNDLHLLFTVAQEMRLGVQRHGILDILRGRLLCTMFFEPSTRTSASFDAAMQRLGGRTVAISTAHSSTVKGESLQDSIRTLGCYGDAIVLRHPSDDSADLAARFSPVPIINGGNGSREHPTQAFLDLFTIREELGTVNGLTITFTGDLKYGRTVHSLCKLLEHYDVSVQLVSPSALALPPEVRQQLISRGQLVSESTELTPHILARSDVLYCTRVQKERFSDLDEYERLKDSFIIDNKVLKNAKSTTIVMHPLPRNAEIQEEVDFDQRAAYFRQMKYGLYCRMALLALVMAPVSAYVGLVILVLGGLVVAFFIYDATTYREDPSSGDVPVSEFALNPKTGGPKNLPIVDHFIDDDEDDEKRKRKHKPKLVILGCGWGSVALLKVLHADEYHITVIAPSNYFLFTPMLPSATVGTLELRSLVEPIRRIMSRVRGHFIKGEAVELEISEKLVEVAAVAPGRGGEKTHFYVPYDKLVIGVGRAIPDLADVVLMDAAGSISNPHGVKGLEHCNFLKDINDASRIRNHIVYNLETACLPTTPDDERRRLLSFVVCGGGPTGVEFAAELFDMLNEDLTKFYPRLLRNEISVHLIQSRGHILNTYDEALSKFAEARFAHDNVNVLTNARVKEVQEDKILFTQKDGQGNIVTKELPMGFCLWSTGVSQNEFCSRLSNKLPGQNNRHALETDSHLRVIGTPLGDIYAIGDCSTVQNNISDHIVSFLRTLAWERGKDPETLHISFNDWRSVAQRVKKRFPQASDHLRRLDRLFEKYDKNKSGKLDFGELYELLKQIDTKLTSLPATAQRANQQGKYLARKFNKLAQAAPGMRLNQVDYGDLDDAVYKAFEYKHLGSLAYVGNAAVFDFGGLSLSGGLLAAYLWRSVYFAQSVSFRTRCLLAMDWSKRALFGRDLMNF